jgi:nucleoid-associated protein YgaU
MGLIDFVRNAGAKLFGRDEEPKEKVNPEEVKRKADTAKAETLEKLVSGLGLEVEDLRIEFTDSVATVFGKTDSQAEKEKVILAVGNVNGVGSVDDRLEVSIPEPEAVYYTVVRGDTLSKIAKEHYGNAMKYPVIFEANKPMLKDPDKIYPGQVLRIPPLNS